MAINVLGTPLQVCSTEPMTGYYRDGCCNTDATDRGSHVICAEVTDEFLTFSRQRGNDLSTPRPEYRFPGLVAGDRWCLCALRWKEAFDAGVAPNVVLESTHINALQYVDLAHLLEYQHQQ
ncbi:MAG: DUF2237 family protein [Burkholderiaceae bacterium]|jgi:hypothetical protein|nr:DUF2237 domain-containing protein [Oxalobacteraceae bacterium]MCX7216090.1 DUF2237 domain-containing protein [Burkholderiales bacterium]